MCDITCLKTGNLEYTIFIKNNFTYSCLSKYQTILQEIQFNYSIIIDLSECNYMDSSALGMLLLLLEKLNNDDEKVIIRNPSDVVKKILEISRFDLLFTIQ